jgi:hypothetical protein
MERSGHHGPDGVTGDAPRVTLETGGGFAAGIRLGRPARVVDPGLIGPDDRDTLWRLVDAAETEASPDAPPRRGADAVTYTVTVAAPEAEPVVLHATDLTMTDAFADLVDWIETHATNNPP